MPSPKVSGILFAVAGFMAAYAGQIPDAQLAEVVRAAGVLIQAATVYALARGWILGMRR